MIPAVDTELKEIVLSNNSFGPNEIKILSRRISDDYSQFPVLRDLTNELESQTSRSPASSVRLGVCQFLLGRYRSAFHTLENADGGALAELPPSPRERVVQTGGFELIRFLADEVSVKQ